MEGRRGKGRSLSPDDSEEAREERDDKLMANALRRGCQHSRLPLKAPVARADCGGMNQSLPASVILRGPGPKSTGFLRKLRCTAAAHALSVVRVALLFALQCWEPGCGTQQKVHQSLNWKNNRERRETFVLVYCGWGNCDSVSLSEPRMGDVLLGSWPESMAAPAFSSSLITHIHLASRKRPNVAQRMLLTTRHRLTTFFRLGLAAGGDTTLFLAVEISILRKARWRNNKCGKGGGGDGGPLKMAAVKRADSEESERRPPLSEDFVTCCRYFKSCTGYPGRQACQID
ncbi:hypothetical protein SRHO_G00262340 [Serrasalmus rhombeus]